MKITTSFVPPVIPVKEYNITLTQREAELLFMLLGPMGAKDFVNNVNMSEGVMSRLFCRTNMNEADFFFNLHLTLSNELS